MSKRLPFLRSCLEECDPPIKTEVKGVIPVWLKGTLLRNGPGLQEVGTDKYNHMFDGLALMHRFHINNGEVSYQNKFLRSDAYLRNLKAQRIVVSEFGTTAYPDPCQTIWRRFMSHFWTSPEMTDNDSVNIYPVGDQLYAATETKFIRRIDGNTLATHEKVDLSKYLTVNTATAHPHVHTDGSVYNMGSSFGPKGKYHLIRIPNEDNAFENSSIVCSIPMDRPFHPSYYHSFSISSNYYIFIEQPLVLSVPTIAMTPITGKPFAECLVWKPELMTRFHIIERTSGKLINTKYMAQSFAFFHTINAFEDNNQLVVDICCYPDGQIISTLNIQNMTDMYENHKKFDTKSEVRRFVLPLVHQMTDVKADTNLVNLEYTKASASLKADKSVQLNYEPLTPSGPWMGELPRINYKFNGHKYRYFYSLMQTEDYKTKLLKFDTKTKESVVWSEDNTFPSEPVFIENPDINYSDENNEDEGVILSSVLSESDETKGFLLILNAKTMQELGRAQLVIKRNGKISLNN
ncbi:unnamed protein product [Oppiella nova]|uniref:Uncharacterized protein n=2 Tax=Oppiella nova TaxID=334625 RepID=A0A7R9LZA1_9ACAR|nr:unnamed protein product [Oppiella nova]CAG2167808.1 unnamed protein product [Oppiella nova]